MPSKVTNFRIWFSQGFRRHISINSGEIAAFRASVSATGDTEAWCSGAIDTVFSFVQSRKLWYGWILTRPAGVVLWLLMWVPPALSLAGVHLTRAVGFAWTGCLLLLFFLWIFSERFLPSAVIRIYDGDGFVRRHGLELSLAIALLSAILTVIGWFVAK
jgi:hypothetical protein